VASDTVVVRQSADDSLQSFLVTASVRKWSGQVSLRSGSETVGLIILNRGRVAWAKSKDQKEDIAGFLWRLGRVTKEQLAAVRNRYQELGGRRKFGALLEETHFIREPVLRWCLLLHARMAIDSMLERRDAELTVRDGEIKAEEEMTFTLEEVMPKVHETEERNPGSSMDSRYGRWTNWNEENQGLSDLEQLNGYLASAIVSGDGEVLAAHTKSGNVDPLVLGVYLASVLEASSRAVKSTQLGSVNFVLLDCESGALVARWIDQNNKNLAVVLVGSDGQIGMVKHRINSMLQTLESQADLLIRKSHEDATPTVRKN
jgi:predicted regulator of Ras-like GTPase activity (Roadblock/LC7/MglB family)